MAFYFMVYVYFLFSQSIKQHYCGQSENVIARLEQHNLGKTVSNKHGIPWTLIGYVETTTRSEAVKLEKQIKKRGIKRWLEEHEYLLIKTTMNK